MGHTGAQHHVGDELIADAAGAPLALICPAIPAGRAAVVPPAPHKDFSDLYETMSGKGESASDAHSLFIWASRISPSNECTAAESVKNDCDPSVRSFPAPNSDLKRNRREAFSSFQPLRSDVTEEPPCEDTPAPHCSAGRRTRTSGGEFSASGVGADIGGINSNEV